MNDHKMSYILTLSCPNRPGIVAAVSSKLFECGANITEAQQFDDKDSTNFFMRLVFTIPDDHEALTKLQKDLSVLENTFTMKWSVTQRDRPVRTLLLVSRFDHCLVDLLYRWRIGELTIEPVGIVSNHPLDTFETTDFHGIPFYYLPITKENKKTQEEQIWNIFKSEKAELIILARYMQILSGDLTCRLSGQCINIHHSFLPGFKGARPYHQAYARGVKLIGATAHYVTSTLDEGPIIEQDVQRISHADTPEDLIRKGRDIERHVLAEAVRYHVQRRVILRGNKTIVFNS